MRRKRQSGFTLVELAVVVVLVAILTSTGLSALTALMASASNSATKTKHDTIKYALITYLGKNKRLPCPAIDPGGNESRNGGTPSRCTGFFGILPYGTLGLTKTVALDGWEDFFSYAVASQWTLTYSTAAPSAGVPSTNVAGEAFNVGIAGTLTVRDRTPATNATTTTISSNAVVFLVSHGKNELGAFTFKGTQNASPAAGTDEIANVPVSSWAVPAAFYQREYNDTNVPTYGAFDDVTQLLNSTDLITPLMRDGALKSAEAQWTEQITNINNAIIGAMFNDANNRCEPPVDQTAFNAVLTTNGIPNVDPWGGLLTRL